MKDNFQACLVEDDGHHEEIQQEIFRNVSVVESEEDDSEAQSNKLINGITEGGTKEFHPSNCYQDNITAVRKAERKTSSSQSSKALNYEALKRKQLQQMWFWICLCRSIQC